jgi:hypothetical protein
MDAINSPIRKAVNDTYKHVRLSNVQLNLIDKKTENMYSAIKGMNSTLLSAVQYMIKLSTPK